MTKILSIDALADRIKYLAASGKKIVFTNGCFDILHAGHVQYLKEASALGDILVVGLNSDKSVHHIKGNKRPVMPQDQRAEVLTALSMVDFVVLFDEPGPLQLIQKIKPHVLVKGGDWAEDEIIGAAFVKDLGGKVERIPFVHDISTSKIIEEIVKRYQ